jgi:hypothetical protein
MSELEEKEDEGLAEVTDDELSAAFDSFLEGKEDVKVEEEPIVEEHEEREELRDDLSQGERTGLGRKVAKLHERLDNLTSGMATKSDLLDILKRLDDIKSVTKSDIVEEDPYEHDEFHIESKEDLDRYLERRDRSVKEKEINERKAYENDYMSTMKELLSDIDDKTVASEVYNELVKPNGEFNKVLSGNPISDCSKNFFRAFKHIEKEKNKSPFTREVKDQKTGVSGGTSTQNKNKIVPKLDEEAAEFARKMGMSEDDIIESLAKEAPMGLRR